jgi:alkylation response protein AidB-like acyl-CoA dehydrogenase
MDLELSDEQRWLSESVDTLLDREWLPVTAVAESTVERRRRVWGELVTFGALSLGGEDGTGAVEACLIARSLGAHLAAAPFVDSAAVRLGLAGGPAADSLDAGAAHAIALLEPGSSWSGGAIATTLRQHGGRIVVAGEKVAVEQLDLADELAVVATLDGEPALARVPTGSPQIVPAARPSFDETLPTAAVRFDDASVDASGLLTGATAERALGRLTIAGALLACAESTGAAERLLAEACRYAGERRQFGRTIASFQSVRHILADMYVRCASGWSTVLYAAAAFDEGADDAAQSASIAKAYVARGAREVAHGAIQVFGGIAFTAEHPAHRFLRRIIVRERQFGDAAHHERELGRSLARRGTRTLVALAEAARG